MFFNKKNFCLAVCLILLVNIDIGLLHNLYRTPNDFQIKIESLLPQKHVKAETVEFGNVRVLLKTNGFAQITHPEVKISSDVPLKVTVGSETTIYGPQEVLHIVPSDQRFAQGSIRISAEQDKNRIQLLSFERGYGSPSYRGALELFKTAEGIVIINELPMEEYLYAVVPSEMPASYEQEALKVQAVCARSYAYNQTRNYAYPEYRAHVDDSTSFQVYGNSKEQDSTIRAVNETAGELLWYGDRVVTAYYFSTSSGRTTSIQAWGTMPDEYNGYLKSVSLCDENGNAYESELPWYRWKARIPVKTLCNLLELNTGVELGELQAVNITAKGDGGIVQEITAVGTVDQVTVMTENKIRRALGGSGYQIEKQDGTVTDSSALLPSAFFEINKNGEAYQIDGGGYGHGIGMSQNGANEMAKAGKNYREILTMFYSGVEIK